MKKWLQKRLKNEKGLTLVELLAVIVILGIIAAIAVPSIGGIIGNSKVGALKSDVINAINASELYLLESSENTARTTVTLEDLLGTTTGATNDAYLTEKGSLVNFTYTIASKTATFEAENGSVSIESTTGATKKQVNDLPNNTKDGVTAENITVTR